MKREITIEDLKAMGFSDPWPEYTMSKIIPTIRLGIIAMLISTREGESWYVYFGTGKDVDWEDPFKILNETREKFHFLDGSIYPRVYTKKDVEDICFALTGKSIYNIDIKSNEFTKVS